MLTEQLEAAILESITYVRRTHDLKMHVDRKYMDYLSRLRNQISAYKLNRSEAEIDDLCFAIIRDDGLTTDQIKMAFDLNDSLFLMMIHRMKARENLYK
mgnify:CR=1 FL=1